MSLPWAVPSLPTPWSRVNRPLHGAGTQAAAAACSRDASDGSCRAGPRPATVALPVGPPHAAGAAGWPLDATAPPAMADNAAATRPDAIAAGLASDPPPLSRILPRPGRVDAGRRRGPAAPCQRSGTGRRRPRRGPAPGEIPDESDGCPCHRPGCYVLFLPTPRSPDRRFCSAPCRRALRRVRQREARTRRRRRRGIPPRRRPRRGPPPHDSLMSSRIEQSGP